MLLLFHSLAQQCNPLIINSSALLTSPFICARFVSHRFWVEIHKPIKSNFFLSISTLSLKHSFYQVFHDVPIKLNLVYLAVIIYLAIFVLSLLTSPIFLLPSKHNWRLVVSGLPYVPLPQHDQLTLQRQLKQDWNSR